ncbi:MAG: WXG100 family type VII secretion target [Nocardia sp.]|nr:WXG100 family type VII secretion target [Nocardia sp.]
MAGAMGDGTIGYEFAGINDGGDGIKQTAHQILQALDDMHQQFVNFVGVDFHGAGADAFQDVQTSWHQKSVEMNIALQKLGIQTVNAGEGMQAADAQAAGLFH